MMTRLQCIAALAFAACGGEGIDPSGTHESALSVATLGPAPVEPGALRAEWAIPVVHEVGAEAFRIDLDGDGFSDEVDVDDEDPLAYPGAEEARCDGIDQDGDLTDFCPGDADGDGMGVDVDCDDLDARVGPLALETFCDGRDDNCNGVDECDRDGDGADDSSDRAPDDPAVGAARGERFDVDP